ncbi:DNA replication ATP-dependent helicase/nuclease DNA2 [Scaptodrosophila lebanonensis]|uniref:DNA replication ATP-dependent helicase/nuclease n=1 Tax=Drosophila lebanonensis TaxID=7225 RepID=A0A6J2TWV5_DROLE|nr:DNA replication ATP-dependent helicase/nuclease DNA2 [Scaptodrosophila lebanonensis]
MNSAKRVLSPIKPENDTENKQTKKVKISLSLEGRTAPLSPQQKENASTEHAALLGWGDDDVDDIDFTKLAAVERCFLAASEGQKKPQMTTTALEPSVVMDQRRAVAKQNKALDELSAQNNLTAAGPKPTDCELKQATTTKELISLNQLPIDAETKELLASQHITISGQQLILADKKITVIGDQPLFADQKLTPIAMAAQKYLAADHKLSLEAEQKLSAAEQRLAKSEQRRVTMEKKRLEKEQKRAADLEQKRIAKEQKRAAVEEQKRLAAEQKRLAAEKKHAARKQLSLARTRQAKKKAIAKVEKNLRDQTIIGPENTALLRDSNDSNSTASELDTSAVFLKPAVPQLETKPKSTSFKHSLPEDTSQIPQQSGMAEQLSPIEPSSSNLNQSPKTEQLPAAEQSKTEDKNRPKLNLTLWQRCLVESTWRKPKTSDLVLVLRSDDKEVAECVLQGPWMHTQVQSGDLVSVQADWDQNNKHYVVNRNVGLIAVHPDILISTTTVASSLFCRRKAVLMERFRGIDTGNVAMVIGTAVHKMFEIAITQDMRSPSQLERIVEEMVHSTDMIKVLYANKLKMAEFSEGLTKFVDPIITFIRQFVHDCEKRVPLPEQFQGHIHRVVDIEENLWVPRLGLKGKIDATVTLRPKQGECNKYHDPVPLELKTGRPSFSFEHQGQLLLYQLMSRALGSKVDNGLLVYIRDGIVREVLSARNEQRDLIIARNELAHYFTREAQVPAAGASLKVNNEGMILQPFPLPEPISHHSACSKCPYVTICSSFAATDPDLELSESHPLRKLMPQKLEHLNPVDFEYFIHWCGLLTLEEQEARKSVNISALWNLPRIVRQQQGRAILDLYLRPLSSVFSDGDRFHHTMHVHPEALTEELDLTLSGFELGEYVIISSTDRLAISTGFIKSLTKDSVGLLLERDLRKLNEHSRFIIDKHESQSFNVFSFTNLGLLIDASDRGAQLRQIIIDRIPPIYSKELPRTIYDDGHIILSGLNSLQRNALLRAVATNSYLLLKGLPGTGKTETLVALIRFLNLMDRTVLITSHTHSAVDNLMVRLLPFDLPMLRLGAPARTHPKLMEINEAVLTKSCKNEEDMEEVFASRTIVGVTCLGSNHVIFNHQKFDYCIVDEATQVFQPTVLRPLWHCSKFILVGDPDQLPPLVKSRVARQRGADESLFHRLDSKFSTVMLTKQYRMNRAITKLANALTYDGALECGNDLVEKSGMPLSKQPSGPRWVVRALQSHVDQSVILLDTLDSYERMNAYAMTHKPIGATGDIVEQHYGLDGKKTYQQPQRMRRITKYANPCELAVVFQILRRLLEAGCPPSEIGVIAPYRAQVELMRSLISKCVKPRMDLVEFNTVDQYQGRDKSVIIYSCTKTCDPSLDAERPHDAEILEDKRRLTVAITRAKHKLIILGDVKCLQRHGPFQKLFASIPSICRIELDDGSQGFSWHSVFSDFNKLWEHSPKDAN